MKHKPVRLLIAALAAFNALSAIGGGIALLWGTDRFPVDWLHGTPFSDYAVPALVLALVVGASSLAAVVTLFTRPKLGVFATMIAGLVTLGYLSVEIAILKQVPPGPTVVELVYTGLGGILCALAVYLWYTEYRSYFLQARQMN